VSAQEAPAELVGAPAAPAPRRLAFSSPACLCCISELPEHLRFNAFVHRGYRCGLGTRAAARSMCRLHNESLNIWTHAVACAFACAALCVPLAPEATGLWHLALRCCATAPMVLSFGLSVIYHTFLAHKCCSTSKRGCENYHRLLSCDVAGVVGVLSVPQVAILCYGFGNQPTLRDALLALSAIAAAVGSRAVRSVDQTARAVPLSVLLLTRWLCLALRLLHYGLRCDAATGIYARMELLLALGGAANALFLPERWCPGRLDYALNSHQIMHLCTTATAVMVVRALQADIACAAGV